MAERDFIQKIATANEFGEGWTMIEDPNVFKSAKGRAGTLQLTFN
jgi:hypothetical protein